MTKKTFIINYKPHPLSSRKMIKKREVYFNPKSLYNVIVEIFQEKSSINFKKAQMNQSHQRSYPIKENLTLSLGISSSTLQSNLTLLLGISKFSLVIKNI
jgi:hypothetical protein